MYRNKIKKQPAVEMIRVLLSLVFIFSGFVKAVDPWGTAIKLEEYFNAFGMEWLTGARYALSIALSSFELTLGLLLLLRVCIKPVSFLTALFMVFMTILTLVIALTNPVSDCGCFGDAVKLTNWQTFVKNIILLTMAILLLISVMGKRQPDRSAASNLIILALSVAISVWIGVHCLRHLPLIDFLPYKTGVNIPRSMDIPEGKPMGEYITTLVYRNILNGEVKEFEVEDTTWYDNTTWEFVDSYSTTLEEAYVPPIGSFNIFNSTEDATYEILEAEGDVFLFTIDNLPDVTHKDAQNIRQALAYAQENGNMAVCITTSPLSEGSELMTQGIEMPLYNMDATTLKSMIRAHKGLIILNKGTIIAKWNLRDIPSFKKAENTTPTGYVISQYRNMKVRGTLILFGAAIILLIVLRKCKK